jgi:hypothetical protein
MPPFSKYQEFDDSSSPSPERRIEHHKYRHPSSDHNSSSLVAFKLRRIVSFKEGVQIIDARQGHQYDPSNKWLSRNELRKINRNIRQILRRYEEHHQSMFSTSFDECLIGLERIIKKGKAKSLKIKNNARLSVFREQFIQRQLGLHDCDTSTLRIGIAYAASSAECRQDAINVALEHAAEVILEQQLELETRSDMTSPFQNLVSCWPMFLSGF